MADNKKHTLKDIQLYEENGRYYLRLKYIIEDDHRIQELEIPKVSIKFNGNAFPQIDYECVPNIEETCTLKAGYLNGFNVYRGKTSEADDVFYTVKTVEEKPEKLTISEIEKKLGYKIEIVSEESK